MPDPYASRIQAQRQRIKQHSGDDSQLRQRLNQLRARRSDQRQSSPTQTPWSAEYETAVGQINRDAQNLDTSLTAQQQSVEKAYGFNNNSDPFSRATQLQQNFQNANQGTGNNYAAAGQLYAGSLTNARNIDRHNFETSWDTEQKAYQAKLDEIAQRRLEGQNENTDDLLAAEANRLEAAVAERVDPAEAPKKNKGGKGGGQQNKPNKNKPKKGR